MDVKDKSIAFQNATTAAAAIYAAQLANHGGEYVQTDYESIREDIFTGTAERIAGFEAEALQEAFPGSTWEQPELQPGPVASVTPIPTPAAQLAAAVQPAPAGPAAGGPGPLPEASSGPSNATEALWQDLFNNFSGWWDNRADKAAGKVSGNGPDFKRKSDKKGLWINGKAPTPQWVKERLGA